MLLVTYPLVYSINFHCYHRNSLIILWVYLPTFFPVGFKPFFNFNRQLPMDFFLVQFVMAGTRPGDVKHIAEKLQLFKIKPHIVNTDSPYCNIELLYDEVFD